MKITVGRGVLEMTRGDITLERVDAIVNAANAALAGGGGVDGAIHRRGGPGILEECRRIGGCPPGSVAMTSGGALAAGAVLHAVGPIWRGGTQGEAAILASCYRSALELARDSGFDSIAFPSISTGAYGYPADRAARVALAAVKAFMEKNSHPALVRMVMFDADTFDAYAAALEEV